ncbi:MAG: FAD-dependent oxidoreductase, partial [Thermomicrobiales bacterium]
GVGDGPLVHGPDVNIRPDGPDRVLLHHDRFDGQLGDREEMSPGHPLVRDLIAAGTHLMPALARATTVDVRIGIRAITADGHPSAGPLTALPGYVEAVTHSGVTLGPLLGRLLAAEILTGTRSSLLATFHPDRFPRD